MSDFKAGDVVEFTRNGMVCVGNVWSPSMNGSILLIDKGDGYGPKELVAAHEAKRLNAYHVGDEVYVRSLSTRFTVDNVFWETTNNRCGYDLSDGVSPIMLYATEGIMRPGIQEPERNNVMPAVEVGQKWSRTSRQGDKYHLTILGVDEESHTVWVKPSWGTGSPFTTPIGDLSKYSLADNFFEKVGGLPKTGYLLAAVEGDDDSNNWAIYVEGKLFDTVEEAEDDLAGYGAYGADLRVVKATIETVE